MKHETVLSALMAQKGIKNVDVSRDLCVTEIEVSRWRNGRGYVPPKHRLTLAKLLDVRVEDILDARGIAKLS